jgi:beta-carotene 15,15'-dioxygenase
MAKTATLNTQLNQYPSWISLVIGLGLCTWQYRSGQLPDLLQAVFFIVMLAVTGIPHGALDHLVAQETARQQNRSFNLWPFMLRYIGTMLLYALVWFGSPLLSLALFLIISAWHFGETDIDQAPDHWLWNLTRLLTGTWVLLFILLTHAAEVGPVWIRITQEDPTALWIWQTATQYDTYLILMGLALLVVLFSIAYRSRPIRIDLIRYGHWAFILILCYYLPLLPAFALYFSGWHALYSFRSIGQHLSSGTTQVAPLDMLQIWLKSLPLTGVALLFLGAMAYLWHNFLNSWDPLPVLFIFISLITLPHLNVMSGMNSARR